eukprot:TRINITY_DN35831_c0_g2_i14.p1 TRINITY_DN35831_c0_g2~~TRINITY_DN35831_c0_g2_i14.p1  ORF type:complete len:336 (-),score=64.31 TRINITY_DN35831_c0_g2_i14:549-1556(-)
MLDAMMRAGYPRHVIDITADAYTDSTFQVQARGGLTPKITRHRGIVQGCPWSAIAFIQALDPWIRWMEQPFVADALLIPCQAYMDDVCATANSSPDIEVMMQKMEAFLNYTGMLVNHQKWAVIQGQRKRNSWANMDCISIADLSIQEEVIPKHGTELSYPYLGFQINLTGTAARQQALDAVEEFIATVDNIYSAPLPVNKKLDAINIMAASKLNFYFSNLRFAEKLLKMLEDLIVSFTREQLKFNSSSTRAQIFAPRRCGGLGLLKPSTMYYAKRLSFLLLVLNNDDNHVRDVARGSFKLHMQKRKVQLTGPDEDNSRWLNTKAEQDVLATVNLG